MVPIELVVDIETNGLLYEVDAIHLIVAKELDGDSLVFHDDPSLPSDGSVADGIAYVMSADHVVGHNYAGYDVPVMEKALAGWKRPDQETVRSTTRLMYEDGWIWDTMLASKILHPKRKQHSIKSYYPDEKVENEDWVCLTPTILERCVSDVELTERLYKDQLQHIEEKGFDLVKAMRIETAIAYLQALQEYDGKYIDQNWAHQVLEFLMIEEDKLTREIQAKAPKVCVPITSPGTKAANSLEVQKVAKLCEELTGRKVSISDPGMKFPSAVMAPMRKPKMVVVAKPLKKNRQPSVRARKYVPEGRIGGPFTVLPPWTEWWNRATLDHWSDDVDYLIQKKVKGPFTRIEFRPVNLGSPIQRQQLLYSLGWAPQEWNYKMEDGKRVKTGPKLTEDSFDSISDPVLGPAMKEWLIVNHRRKFMYNGPGSGILGCLREDGRVPAEADTCGTNTARHKHKKPCANIPGVHAPYGAMIRGCFAHPPGRVYGNSDLSGIENRLIAHFAMKYLGGEEFVKKLEGDFHSNNAKVWGVSRSVAKSMLYALLFGCSGKKLAEIAGVPENKGTTLKEAFFNAYPALDGLYKDLEAVWDSGRRHLIGLDGRPLFVPSKHRLLNVLIQGSAAILFKVWEIRQVLDMPEHLLKNSFRVSNFHDEVSLEVREDLGEEVMKFVSDLATEVGKQFDLNIRIDADWAVGPDFASTH